MLIRRFDAEVWRRQYAEPSEMTKCGVKIWCWAPILWKASWKFSLKLFAFWSSAEVQSDHRTLPAVCGIDHPRDARIVLSPQVFIAACKNKRPIETCLYTVLLITRSAHTTNVFQPAESFQSRSRRTQTEF